MTNSKIEWTDKVWNPLTGCTHISPGCDNCYADAFANRRLSHKYRNGFELTMHEEEITRPDRWKKPQLVFVNSMADLFHGNVPQEFIQRVFAMMGLVGQHHYQILTKRADRLKKLAPQLAWLPNIWMGVSVENADYIHRIRDLQAVPANVRFLSIEPFLGPIPELPLQGIHWVIVGGESGRGARPMDIAWVRGIRDQCIEADVPFFFKQWGSHDEHGQPANKKETGRLLDGELWDQYPVGFDRIARAFVTNERHQMGVR